MGNYTKSFMEMSVSDNGGWCYPEELRIIRDLITGCGWNASYSAASRCHITVSKLMAQSWRFHVHVKNGWITIRDLDRDMGILECRPEICFKVHLGGPDSLGKLRDFFNE